MPSDIIISASPTCCSFCHRISTCPLLSSQGCALPAEQRPYNCISFLCDRIDERLPPQKIEFFYLFEAELRGLYRSSAERYAGGSLSGLLLDARRLQGQPFLKRLDSSRFMVSPKDG